MLTYKKETNIVSIYTLSNWGQIYGISINLIANCLNSMGYAKSRKWSGFKTREHHKGFLFFKFYFKDFKHFDDA